LLDFCSEYEVYTELLTSLLGRTILVLGYPVLANTGRYWGGLGIGRYFIDCETQYRLPRSRPTAYNDLSIC